MHGSSARQTGVNYALPAGTELGGYTVEAVLGQGGFGIVYRARHKELHFLVAIKEYLPTEMAIRSGTEVQVRGEEWKKGFEDGLRRFLEEARALIALRDVPVVVECRDLFRANGTAYLVMEYEVGLPLSEVLAQREAAGTPFTESDLLAVAIPLVNGLAQVHAADVLHRDIKPSNILIRRADEQPVLIDFGASKQAVAVHTKSLAPYTAGYAAPEQVGEDESLGPWTDIYAVGAVMWRMVAGGERPWDPPNPVKAESRLLGIMGKGDPLPTARSLGAGRFSGSVLEVIDRCLAMRAEERVQNCRDLLRMLGLDVDRNTKRAESRSARSAGVKTDGESRGGSALFPPAQASGDEPPKPADSTAVRSSQIGKRNKWLWRMLAGAAVLISVLVSIVIPSSDAVGPGGMEFVRIPAGEFVMGFTSNYWRPRTHVQISRGFQLGKYEVTQGQWLDVMGNNPSWFKSCGKDCPVENVSWHEVHIFIARLNAIDHEWRYRLPTEAEWEYAATGGSGMVLTDVLQSASDVRESVLREVAWWRENSSKTQPVGQLAPNEWGLYDTFGNVWEWTADRYGRYPGKLATDPIGPSKGSERVYRGCSWDSDESDCAHFNRSAEDPNYRYHNVGLRLLRVKLDDDN